MPLIPALGRQRIRSKDKEVAQESMGVTLAMTHYIGDMETEEATSCSHKGAPVEQKETPTHPQNFQSKIYPVYK